MSLSNSTKRKLEALLNMGGGYVLRFSNAEFRDFVVTAIGVDPYAKEYASKANLLRRLWQELAEAEVARLNLELIECWKDGKAIAGEAITEAEQGMYDQLREEFSDAPHRDNAVTTEFLLKDFGEVDLTALPSALRATDVVDSRLEEIDRAIKAEAPLAVVFLVGSTLEGLLADLALAQAQRFVDCGTAPRVKGGTVKPLPAWSLSELITVARDLGVLSLDVAKHADQVRNFRNYIHPRQQLKENFAPRIETARIAQQVLIGALKDLEALHSRDRSLDR